jgi:hypothetical protein
MQALTEYELAESQEGYFNLWIDALWQSATIERRDDWTLDLPAEPGIETLLPEVLEAITALEAE